MMPRLVVTLMRAFAAVNCVRLTIRGTDDVSAGLNIDTATASRRTRAYKRLTVNCRSGWRRNDADQHSPQCVRSDEEEFFRQPVHIDADKGTEHDGWNRVQESDDGGFYREP